MIELFKDALKQGEALAGTIPLRNLFARNSSVTGTQIVKAGGSSTEYFDHRPYQPGDDPRFIDWNAYGRTEQFNIRIFQRETAPHVDVIVDYSPSLFINGKKALRTMELIYYFLVAAERIQAKTRFFFIAEDRPLLIAREELLQGSVWRYQPLPNTVRMIDGVLLQAGSNNIVISDLLFPGNPDSMCAGLTRTPGTALLFIPYLNSEASPDWVGSVEFNDCEHQGRRRLARCDRNFLVTYRNAYTAHCRLWEEAALRYGILLLRTCADEHLSRQPILSSPYHHFGSSLR